MSATSDKDGRKYNVGDKVRLLEDKPRFTNRFFRKKGDVAEVGYVNIGSPLIYLVECGGDHKILTSVPKEDIEPVEQIQVKQGVSTVVSSSSPQPGDKYRLTQEYPFVQYLCYNHLPIGTILTFHDSNMFEGGIRYKVSSYLKIFDGMMYIPEKYLEPINQSCASTHSCTCNLTQLMSVGCRCGGR